jgi:hypothetical protein
VHTWVDAYGVVHTKNSERDLRGLDAFELQKEFRPLSWSGGSFVVEYAVEYAI